MNRRLFALLLVLALTGAALAVTQERTYMRLDGRTPGDGSADDVVAVQQHATFVEIITQGEGDKQENVTEFAAVVGLVKKCKRVDNVFDNAILWLNDQFLFGNKSNFHGNATANASRQGYDPVRVHTNETLYNENRENGTGRYDPETGTYEADENGTGPNQGGNPVREGFIRGRDLQERWGGCYIPNGFLYAVPSGQSSSVKSLIDTDHDCDGCLFVYDGTFYVTDPNDHRWMIDRFSVGGTPVYTVHLQTDPWNPDGQGFPDEAIWAYREDGRLRVGMPYNEDPDHLCHDEATVYGEERYNLTGIQEPAGHANWTSPHDHDEDGEQGGEQPGDAWRPYRRGPLGNTVECAIEYNFLVAVAFDGFSSAGTVAHGEGRGDDSNRAWRGNAHPSNPERERCEVRDDGMPYPHTTACRELQPGERGWGGPPHDHTTVRMDLFFDERGPFFTEGNPYWDFANQTYEPMTHGTPPRVNETCATAVGIAPSDYRAQAVTARTPLVCDVTADTGFHLHDGSQTNPPR